MSIMNIYKNMFIYIYIYIYIFVYIYRCIYTTYISIYICGVLTCILKLRKKCHLVTMSILGVIMIKTFISKYYE